MSAADLVYRAGDRIRGWGRLVVDDEGHWLDLARLDDLIWRPGPKPRHAVFSIRLAGAVDLDALSTPSGPPGAVPGHATLTGTWDGTTLHIEEQSPLPPPGSEPEWPDWSVPPCPEPAGGWPSGMAGHGRDNLVVDLGDLVATGAAVTVVTFRPAPDQAVLVVAATDADRVREVLGPQLPGRLCVVPSRWTRAELDAVRDVVRSASRAWTVQMLCGHVDELAQESVRVDLMRVGTDLAAWADSLAPGLLTLQPSLVPVRG